MYLSTAVKWTKAFLMWSSQNQFVGWESIRSHCDTGNKLIAVGFLFLPIRKYHMNQFYVTWTNFRPNINENLIRSNGKGRFIFMLLDFVNQLLILYLNCTVKNLFPVSPRNMRMWCIKLLIVVFNFTLVELFIALLVRNRSDYESAGLWPVTDLIRFLISHLKRFQKSFLQMPRKLPYPTWRKFGKKPMSVWLESFLLMVLRNELMLHIS